MTRGCVSVPGALALATVMTVSAVPTLEQRPAEDQLALAEQSDPGVQLRVGYGYWVGQGTRQDDVAAARWYRLAADQGNAGAQVSLGFMYAKQLLHGPGALDDPGAAGEQPDVGSETSKALRPVWLLVVRTTLSARAIDTVSPWLTTS